MLANEVAEAGERVEQAWESVKMTRRERAKAVKRADTTARKAALTRGTGSKKDARNDNAATLAAKTRGTMEVNASKALSIYNAVVAGDIDCSNKRKACASELEHSQREELFAMLEVIRLVNGGKLKTALQIVFPSTSINTTNRWYPSNHTTIHIDPKWNLPESRRDQIRSAYNNIED